MARGTPGNYSQHVINYIYPGSRMQKYWFKVKPKDSEDEVLLTIVSVNCVNV